MNQGLVAQWLEHLVYVQGGLGFNPQSGHFFSRSHDFPNNYDCGKRASQGYQTGDQVWLEATNLKEARPSKKLSAKQYGPFKILDKVCQSAYWLELPENWQLIHPMFNEVLLTPY